MRPRNNTPLSGRSLAGSGLTAGLALAGLLLLTWAGPPLRSQNRPDDYTLKVDVDLVVLHATVVDRDGRRITELPAERFTIYEDGVPQELALFRNEDVPVTVGLVLDNSASMRDKREQMMAGALTFVESSHPLDETFVVNFHDNAYLDLGDKDFTSDIQELRVALEKTRTRGSTAFYDAIRASLRHLRKGSRQKHVLLVITDGADNVSVSNFDTVLAEAQQAEAAIYIVALPCTEGKRECRRAKREIRKLTRVTGGMAYFPKSLQQVESLCQQIAREIRSQYILGYYPTNPARDGSFRTVQVKVDPPPGYKRLYVRTRPGYYARTEPPAGSQ